jgi:hypothetical protein
MGTNARSNPLHKARKEKAARRRLLNSNLMIVNQTAVGL